WVYGSVADAVLREVAIPVLLIPVASDRTWPEDQRLGLLIALDGSAFSEEVLEPASELGRWLDADIHLVSAVEPTGARAAWTALADAEEYLQRIAQRLRAAGRMVQVHAVAGAPATAIATVAQQEQVDLIAMATHGRGGLSRLVMGSVAAAILQQADLPVLVVRPTAVRHAARPVSGGARLIAEADRSTTLVALTPAEKDFLRHALHGLEQTTEPRSRTAVIVRDLLVKFERAEMLDDEPARPAAPDATMQWEQVDQPECDNRQHGKPERR
ncbi:MAG: universal stress protein, partial [Thermomicrobiales bacterium]